MAAPGPQIATREAIERLTIEVFTEQGISPEHIDPAAPLRLIGIDSLGVAEVAVVINEEFGREIGPYDLEGVAELRALLEIVFAQAGLS
jgi:acyl carrier protein